MKKILKFVIWCFIIAVFLVTAALVGVSVWAATGQRDLSQYNGRIEGSINGVLQGSKIKIGKTYLEWNHLDDLLSIKAEKVELANAENQPIAEFPRIILKYDIWSLITGDMVPSKLYLIAPTVDLNSLVHKGDDKESLDFQDLNIKGLDEVAIINGNLLVPDGSQWIINRAVMKYNDNIFVDALVTNGEQQVVASLRTNMDQSDSHMRMEFKSFDSNSLLYFLPEMNNKRFIANGSAVYTSNSKGKLVEFKINEMVGEIEDPEVFAEKLTVKTGSAEGAYDMDRQILDVKHFAIAFVDDFQLTGSAIITTFNTFVADVDFANLEIVNFKRYWPLVAAPNAIDWIKANMTGGVVTGGKMKLKLTPEEIETGNLAPDAIDVKFEFKDVASSYLPEFAPISKGTGTGTMNGEKITLNIASGEAGNSKITRAVVDFYDLDKPDVYLAVDADVTGDAADLADFYIKLGSGKKLLGSRENITGKSIGTIKLTLPLDSKLKINDIKYAVKAKITEGSVNGLLGAVDANRLSLDVTADQSSYSAIGECYATYIKPGDFTLTDAPISFEVASNASGMRVAVASDITNSTAEIAALELKKTAGEKGKIMVEIIDDGKTVALNKVMLDSDAIRVNAKGSLTKDYSNFANLSFGAQFGKTNIQGRVTNNNGMNVEVKGAYIDAAPLIRYHKNDDDESEDDTPFKFRLRADEIGLMNGQSLKNAYINLSCAKDCDVISLNSEKVMFNQTNSTLIAKVSNVGSILKGFDIYENMVGGQLEINAKVAGDDYDGRIVITDFQIVKAQILARMLTLGSLTGIADILRGKGISFNKLAADFKYTEKEISVKDFRMVGSAIGITANGKIDNQTDIADISGNIIPAYTANTLLGKIPLIGDVIIGSDGVFALAYTLKGNMDNPDLSVNPLSVLAPGFLKGIFQ